MYLHYVLDLWFERVVKPRLRGEAYLVRYIDDFVLCFQYREDALRVQEILRKRLGKFDLTLEPRPSSSNLVALRRSTRASVDVNVRKRSILWASRGTAPAIGKGTFGLGCVQKSHDCDARSCVFRIRCDECGTRHFGSKLIASIKYFAGTMRTTAWPETFGPCGRSIVLWSITGAKC